MVRAHTRITLNKGRGVSGMTHKLLALELELLVECRPRGPEQPGSGVSGPGYIGPRICSNTRARGSGSSIRFSAIGGPALMRPQALACVSGEIFFVAISDTAEHVDELLGGDDAKRPSCIMGHRDRLFVSPLLIQPAVVRLFVLRL